MLVMLGLHGQCNILLYDVIWNAHQYPGMNQTVDNFVFKYKP